MGTAARHITRSSNEGAHAHIAPTAAATEEREAGINCEGDDGEQAVEQVITARLLLERRGQSVERHATCTIPMIPQEGEGGGVGCVCVAVCVCVEGGQIAGGGMKGTQRERNRRQY